MSDTTERMLGEISGKLDRLTDNFDKYISFHAEQHKEVDKTLKAHDADINQAKGAKAAIMVAGGAVAGLVSIAVAAADHWFRK